MLCASIEKDKIKISQKDYEIINTLGIPIYELIKSGTEYVGKTKEIYMGTVCCICMLLSVTVEELISRVKHK